MSRKRSLARAKRKVNGKPKQKKRKYSPKPNRKEFPIVKRRHRKGYNYHHFLYTEAKWRIDMPNWRAQDLSKYFIIRLPMDFHDKLHTLVKPVPMPAYQIVTAIYEDFNPTGYMYEDVLRLIALATKHGATKMAAALQQQVDLIKEFQGGCFYAEKATRRKDRKAQRAHQLDQERAEKNCLPEDGSKPLG